MTGSLKYIAIFIGFILADFYIFPHYCPLKMDVVKN